MLPTEINGHNLAPCVSYKMATLIPDKVGRIFFLLIKMEHKGDAIAEWSKALLVGENEQKPKDPRPGESLKNGTCCIQESGPVMPSTSCCSPIDAMQ